MKQFITVLFVFLFLTQSVWAKDEKMHFHVKYGFIKGGEVDMYIKDTVFNGKPAIYYKIDGRTTGVTNAIYGVREIYETIVDAESLLPQKAIRDVKEGNYTRYNETLFYHDIDSLHSQRKGWREMPHNLVDIISGFFYFLNKNPFDDIHAGDAVPYSVYHADKILDISIKFLREEIIKTDIGKSNSYVLSPQFSAGKMFSRSDAIKVYISKEKKIPVYLELETVFGSLKAKMKSYTIDGVEQKTK